MKKGVGFDLKKFRHIKSDKKTTVLEHEDGHRITVMHRALKPEMRSQLEALAQLPPNEEPQEKAEGGYTEAKRSGILGTGPKLDQEVRDTSKPKPDMTKRQDIPSADSPQQKSAQEKFDSYMKAHPAPKEACGGEVQKYAEGNLVQDTQEPLGAMSTPEGDTVAQPIPPKQEITADPSVNRTRELYNTLVKSGTIVPNTGMPTPVEEQLIGPNGEPPKTINEPAAAAARQMYEKETAQQAQAQEQQNAQAQQQIAGKNKASEALGFQVPKPVEQAAQAPVTQAPPQAQPEPQEPQPIAQAPVEAPQAQQPATPIQQYQVAKTNTHNDLMQHANEFNQDLQNGHITPETYSSLFAKKSTLGKVGTIFGLLLGGAGSGLTHQSNAMLTMMDNEIQRDLDAQKQSKSNALNFLTINNQQQMNQANIRSMNQDTAAKAFALSQAQMYQATYHQLSQQVSSMPEGPQKEAAKQQLGMIYAKIGDKINNMFDQVAGASAYNQLLFGGANAPQSSEEAFQKKVTGMNMLGTQGETRAKYLTDRHIPNVPGEASRPIPEEKRNQIQAMSVLDNKGRDVLNYVAQHTGTWNPKTRAVAEQKIEEMKNFYNDSIKGGALTEGRLGWYDEQFAKHPTDILAQLMGSTAKLKEMVRSNSTRRDLELKGLGFTPQKQQEAPSQGTIERLDPKSGRTVIYDAKTKQPLRWK